MKHSNLLFLLVVLGLATAIQAYNYTTDSLAVRAILDGNGLTELTVASVSKEENGRITELSLANRGLQILTPEISHLDMLKHLDLTDNQLITLPDEIGQLDSLKYLYLARNKLVALPPSIVRLKVHRLIYYPTYITCESPKHGAPCHQHWSWKDGTSIEKNRLCSVPKNIVDWLKWRFPSDWQETQKCDSPFFTSDRSVTIIQDNSLAYKIKHYSPAGIVPSLSFWAENPSWVNISNSDSLWGTPSESGTYSIKAFLGVNDTIYDVLELVVTVTKKPAKVATPSTVMRSSPMQLKFTTTASERAIHAMLPSKGLFSIHLYNPAGKKVWSYNANALSPGWRQVVWNRTRQARLCNGVYLARLTQGSKQVATMIQVLE